MVHKSGRYACVHHLCKKNAKIRVQFYIEVQWISHCKGAFNQTCCAIQQLIILGIICPRLLCNTPMG